MKLIFNRYLEIGEDYSQSLLNLMSIISQNIDEF